MDTKQVLTDIVRTKRCNIKPDKDSMESKGINLVVEYSGLSVEQLLTKCLAHDVIAWQNGQGRKHWTRWQDGQTVRVKASAPAAAAQIDPIEYVLAQAKAAGVEPEDWLKAEAKKRKLEPLA